MKHYLTIDDQVIASSRWDLAAMTVCPHCKGCIKDCHETLADGIWGTFEGADPIACEYECETHYKPRVMLLWNALRHDEALLSKKFPVYAKKVQLSNELHQILCMLHTWDPNGDWDSWDILATPLQTMEIIEDAMAELASDYQDVPGWMNEAIELLLLFC